MTNVKIKMTHAEYSIEHTKIFARMSGHFLTSHLPDDWDTWEEEKLDQFFLIMLGSLWSIGLSTMCLS